MSPKEKDDMRYVIIWSLCVVAMVFLTSFVFSHIH